MNKAKLAVCLSMLLGGCVSSPSMYGNGLTDSNMLPEITRSERSSLILDRISAVPAGYRAPVACRYIAQHSQSSAGRRDSIRGRITLNQHKGAIYSYLELNGQESTASMDRNGLVRQFNAKQLDGGQLLGWEGAEVGKVQMPFEAAPIPEILLLLPQYFTGPWDSGDTVATIYNTERQPVGEYIYQGMLTQYSALAAGTNRRLAALDLITGTPGSPLDNSTSRVIRGYAIVDLDTMLPVAFSYRRPSGGELSVQQSACDVNSSTAVDNAADPGILGQSSLERYALKDSCYGTIYRKYGCGPMDSLSIGGWGDHYYIYLQFDINDLPDIANGGKAEIWLWGSAPNDPGLVVERIAESWSEANLSLNNNPASLPSNGIASSVPASPNWIKVDITELYNSWKAGTFLNYGVKLAPKRNNQTNGSVASSENANVEIRPRLVVTPMK